LGERDARFREGRMDVRRCDASWAMESDSDPEPELVLEFVKGDDKSALDWRSLRLGVF
jgi:hypothetical protein